MKISFFKDIFKTKESVTTDLNKIIETIKNGLIFKELIEKIRITTDKTERNNLKNNLPAITPSGIFCNGRKENNLENYSGLICLDIDNINIFELAEERKKIEQNKFSYIVFTSPSGKGLKVFIKVENDKNKHLESFLALEKYYLNEFNIVIDKACKDFTRLCFLSYDKKIFVNENSNIFELPKIKDVFVSTDKKDNQKNTKTIEKKTTFTKENFVNQDKESEVFRIIEEIKSQKKDITGAYKDWLKIGFSFVDFLGERGRGYFHDISQFYTGYNETETDKVYSNCLKNNTGQTKINTFFFYAQSNGINLTPIKISNSMEKIAVIKTSEPPTAEPPTDNQENKKIELQSKYVRIATNYFKKITQKDKYYIENTFLEKWTKQTIIDDFSNKEFSHPYNCVPKYDTFVNAPDNINYKQVINNCYNIYENLTHNIIQGNFSKTTEFLKHIFQDKFDIGLDYITLLYQKPKQILPILCLVSEERKTGKSTFLKYLRYLFQSNCTILSNENFASNFNSHFATKLIIGIDETFVRAENKEQSERIKKMATDEKTMLIFKGVDAKEIDFYGKLVMCSNDEKNFVHIDEEENRYFINKVPTLKQENPDLLDDLVKEIPFFLHFIKNRKTTYQKETRHFFNDKLLETKALRKVKNESYNDKEKEIRNTIIECFEISQNKELYYTPTQLHEFIKVSNKKIERQDVVNFLKNKMKLKTEKNQRFEFFDLLKARTDENYIICDKSVGTPYKLLFDKFKEID